MKNGVTDSGLMMAVCLYFLSIHNWHMAIVSFILAVTYDLKN